MRTKNQSGLSTGIFVVVMNCAADSWTNSSLNNLKIINQKLNEMKFTAK